MTGGNVRVETALDDVLATLKDGELSPLELRILLELAEHDATPSNLANALGTAPKAIGRAGRRLAMRGLIGRRFDERGRDSHFVLSIRPGGFGALAPLQAQAAEAPPRRGDDLSRAGAVASRTARRSGTGIKDHSHVDDLPMKSNGRDPSPCKTPRRTFGS